jgi:hypothetical protein
MEIYRSISGEILEVSKLPNGRIKLSQVRNAGRRESKSVGTVKELNAFLYNNGYHLAMTDRATLFARRYEEAEDFLTLIDLILDNELAFQKDGSIYTCWFLGFKSNGVVEVKANTDFSYTDELGYKAVTLNISDLIIIQGGIE